MSEEQLSALLAKLKDDAGLREKLQGAADLDAALAMAKEAGFDVSKADWLRHQAEQTLKLSDEELERIAGAHDEYFSMRKEGGMCGTYDTCKIEMKWCTVENEWFHPDQPPHYI